ncbi:hypothetical protein SAMN04244553_0678 [Nocardia amikacinitolerans]|uniref:Transmembrane protein n=1 Tax=Nocardia amikacinitolerans TaxID=756689 RepID=A0A285KUD5_9NOCA|nr:hypothetical protein [Nocardia amikacinitolerans]SNY76292.1 hypothetical protein SAMN04244553_0678 [Nocardia amikacinitolerans]
MTEERPVRSAGIVRRTCRRLGLDRNPMRRREDRLQSGVGMLLTLLFLVVVPLVGIGIGGRVYETESRVVESRMAELRRVDATVVEVGKAPLYAPITPARVSWVDGAGVTRVEDYRSSTLVKPGATVSIWLDRDGRVVEPPSETRALSRAVLLSSAVAGAVLVCFVTGYYLLRASLDRRRARLWETEWATVGLTWGGRGAV